MDAEFYDILPEFRLTRSEVKSIIRIQRNRSLVPSTFARGALALLWPVCSIEGVSEAVIWRQRERICRLHDDDERES